MAEETPQGAGAADQDMSTPAGFAAGAGAQLATVGGQVTGFQNEVNQGSLTLTQEAAAALLAAIGQLQDQANSLVDSSDGLDRQLHFGHNWVGLTMDQRLRSVAAGQTSSVGPVLAQFAELLGQVHATIQRAAGLTSDVDEEQAQLLSKAAQS